MDALVALADADLHDPLGGAVLVPPVLRAIDSIAGTEQVGLAALPDPARVLHTLTRHIRGDDGACRVRRPPIRLRRPSPRPSAAGPR